MRGRLLTGYPRTRARVLGDFVGTIEPSSREALLYLEVDGFMPSALLEATASVGYTEFNATVARSDQPSGIYSKTARDHAHQERRCRNLWTIRGLGAQHE